MERRREAADISLQSKAAAGLSTAAPCNTAAMSVTAAAHEDAAAAAANMEDAADTAAFTFLLFP